MSEPLCVICQRRPRTRAQTCDACPARLGRLLAEIPELYADLGQQGDVPDRRHPDIVILSSDGQPVPLYDPLQTGRLVWVDDGTFDSPHVYEVVPVPSAARGAANGGARVSGTHDAPVPVSLDLIDLTAPARAGSLLPHANAALHQASAVVLRTRTAERHAYAARWTDQVGHLSVATTLDTWVRDWREVRAASEQLPDAAVIVLATWLHTRLDWAADRHPAVDEFAADITDVHAALRGVLGLIGPWPELLVGVPCRRCDTRALYRQPVGHYGAQLYVECGQCGDLMTPEETERWMQLLAASVKTTRRATA
jgi:hypothetical protein